MLYSHLHVHAASQRHNIKDRRMNKRRMIKTQEGRHKKTSLEKYSPLPLLQGFERVVQGLHVRGCWRPNINFIFWPHCYDRHVLSFLFSWFCGPLHRGFRVPPRSGVAFLTTSGLYCLEFSWQLLQGFSGCPLGRLWPSLPHLVSNVWKSAGNCFGTPNSTELNNNSTPTRSPTGSLKSDV